jgi:N utilization substance protein A
VDAAKFVCNALAPAEIQRVIIDEEDRSMEVIVPDEFLSVAIGKRGQNVRLASKLSGWHLDVNSETQYNEAMEKGYDSLVQISGIGGGMADAMFEKGVYSAEDLAGAEIEDLLQVKGIGEEKAKLLIANARMYLSDQQAKKSLEEAQQVEEADAEESADAQATQQADEHDEHDEHDEQDTAEAKAPEQDDNEDSAKPPQD